MDHDSGKPGVPIRAEDRSPSSVPSRERFVPANRSPTRIYELKDCKLYTDDAGRTFVIPPSDPSDIDLPQDMYQGPDDDSHLCINPPDSDVAGPSSQSMPDTGSSSFAVPFRSMEPTAATAGNDQSTTKANADTVAPVNADAITSVNVTVTATTQSDVFNAAMIRNTRALAPLESEKLVAPVIKPDQKAAKDMTILQQVQAFWSTADEKVKDICREAAVIFQWGESCEATFFDGEGNLLVPVENDEHYFMTEVSMRMNNHMPHIRFSIRSKSKIPGRRRDIDHSTHFEPMRYEEPADAEALLDSDIAVSVNFQAYQSHDFVDCSDGASLSEEAQLIVKALSPDMKAAIESYKELKCRPYYIAIEFDLDKAAIERVYLGTPSWAQGFAEQVKSGKCFAIVQDTEPLESRFEILLRAFMSARGPAGSPLMQFQATAKERYVFSAENLKLPPIRLNKDNKLDYQPKLAFHDFSEVLTVHAISSCCELRTLVNKVSDFNLEEPLNLRCVQVPESDDRGFIGWLQMPNDCEFRATPGSRCDIVFLRPSEEPQTLSPTIDPENRSFKAIVRSDIITSGPSGFISLTISRPWNRETQTFFRRAVHFADVAGIPPERLAIALLHDHGNRVRVTWDLSDKIEQSQLRSIDRWYHPGEHRYRTDWNERALTAIVGSHIHTLKPRDMLADIRQSPAFKDGDFLSRMKLSKEQKQAIIGMQCAPGGFAIVQGPAGTGKSLIMYELVKAALRADVNFQILIVSPANTTVNNIAEKIETMMGKTSTNGGKYVLRVYAASTEKAIGRQEALKTRSTKGRRPTNLLEGFDEDDLDATSKLFLKQYREATKARFNGTYDKRVTLPQASVMSVALERTGVVQGPLTEPDELRYAIFRQQYSNYAQNLEVNKEEWKAAMITAWRDTVRGAAVIVSTTAQAGLARITSPLSSSLKLIILDDAVHQHELGLVPLLGAPFEELEGMLQLGDFCQLRPFQDTSVLENVYAEQGNASFMTRLRALGFPTYALKTQHRFTKELAEVANTIAYNGALVHTAAAEKGANDYAALFGKFTAELISEERNKLLVDVRPGTANRVRFTDTDSRYNDLYVAVVADLLQLMFKKAHSKATIAILSPYKAQAERYQQMVNNMRADYPEQVGRVTAAVSDSIPGQEYDYVIMDILITNDGSLGFQKQTNRLTMELTRARNGLVLVTDIVLLFKCREARYGYLARLIGMFKDVRYQYKDTAKMPECQYYKIPANETLPYGTLGYF